MNDNNDNDILTIQFDMVFEPDENDEYTDAAANLAIAEIEAMVPGIRGTAVTYYGPGGGWPVVNWTGPKEAILALLAGPYDDGDGNSWAREEYPQLYV